MQSSDQVESIVQHKVRHASNQKTLKDMRSALNKIKKEHETDRTYAFVGLLIVLPILYSAYQYFFV